MADMHEATFVWPEVDAKDVILTGTFDQWSSSIHLTKTPRGFEGKVKLPWGSRVLYKFVVDGKWVNAESQPEEPDDSGNVNNVYECPSKPEPPTVQTPPVDLPAETVEPKHNEITAASVPASLTAPATEQQTLPEKTTQVAQQVKDTVVTAADEILPGGTGAAFNRAHAAVVVPVVEAAQNIAADPAGTLDQVKESMPPAVTETAQKVSETVKAAVEQTQAAVVPVVAPVFQAAREAVTEKTPEPVKEQVTSTTAVQSKGSDPLNADKIPVATPTPTQDTFVISSQEGPASSALHTPTSRSAAELESKDLVSSDAETVPAVNAVYPTAPTSISSEITPAATTPAESTATAESAPTQSVPAPTNPSDAPSEITGVVQPLLPNDTAVSETPKESAATLAPATDPEAIMQAPQTVTIPTTVDLTPATPGPAASPATETAQTEVESLAQPAPPTSEATEPEATPANPAPGTVDTPAATLAPEATSEVKHIDTEAKPSDQPAPLTAGDVQAAEPTPSPAIADKATNGHSPAATGSTTPTKKPEASESNKSHAFPSSESKTSASTSSSPATSKFGSARKKRVSIFGKVKNLFTHDKDEKK